MLGPVTYIIVHKFKFFTSTFMAVCVQASTFRPLPYIDYSDGHTDDSGLGNIGQNIVIYNDDTIILSELGCMHVLRVPLPE